MSRKSKTVSQIATEAKVDIDEALITLWDYGFKDINSSDDLITKDLNRARRALGLATRRELKSPEYWKNLFNLDEKKFEELLLNLKIVKRPNAKKIPPNSIRKLKSEARRRNIDHITGNKQKTIEDASSLIQFPKFEWEREIIGHERDLHWLEEENIRAIHFAIAEDFVNSPDPIFPAGIRSENLLASATHRQRTGISGALKYPTVELSAAALLHGIVHDHPFHNGNKRTALVSMLVFLDENGYMPTCHENDLFKMVLEVARHNIVESHPLNLADREVIAIAHWLQNNLRAVELGERPVQFRKLRSILTHYGCVLEDPSSGRINISRRCVRSGLLGFKRAVTLKTQIHYGSVGREVGKATIKKIREDLELDDMHGVDSVNFYQQGQPNVSEFISKYRKTLHRLAKL